MNNDVAIRQLARQVVDAIVEVVDASAGRQPHVLTDNDRRLLKRLRISADDPTGSHAAVELLVESVSPDETKALDSTKTEDT